MPVATIGDAATATLPVTAPDVDRYASLVGDDNPLHTDDSYAEQTMFEGRIAHGMFTAGAVSAALADLPGDVVYLSQALEFLAPVRPGETITARAEVVEDLGDDRLRVRTTAETDETVLDGEAIVLSLPHAADGEAECEAGAD